MFCSNCGNSIKEAHRFCTICGAAIEKGVSRDPQDAPTHPRMANQQSYPISSTGMSQRSSDTPLQETWNQQKEPQRKKRRKGPIIVGIVIAILLGVGGFFVAKTLGFFESSDKVSTNTQTTEEDETIPPQLMGTFQGDGFTLTYNTNIWKPGKVGGRDGLVHIADNSELLISAPNQLPQTVLNLMNFSNDLLNKGAYMALQAFVESTVKGEGAQQGYSMTGGSEKFLLLKDETYYATMEYKNSGGFVGAAYVVVSKKDEFNIVCMTKIDDAKNAKSVDEHVIGLFKTIKYTGAKS